MNQNLFETILWAVGTFRDLLWYEQSSFIFVVLVDLDIEMQALWYIIIKNKLFFSYGQFHWRTMLILM